MRSSRDKSATRAIESIDLRLLEMESEVLRATSRYISDQDIHGAIKNFRLNYDWYDDTDDSEFATELASPLITGRFPSALSTTLDLILEVNIGLCGDVASADGEKPAAYMRAYLLVFGLASQSRSWCGIEWMIRYPLVYAAMGAVLQEVDRDTAVLVAQYVCRLAEVSDAGGEYQALAEACLSMTLMHHARRSLGNALSMWQNVAKKAAARSNAGWPSVWNSEFLAEATEAWIKFLQSSKAAVRECDAVQDELIVVAIAMSQKH